MHQIPDWDWHQNSLTELDADQLHALDLLRIHEPILWALCVGHPTSRRIARNLGMPHHIVLYELRQYKKSDKVYDEEHPSGIQWKLLTWDLLELKNFVRALRHKDHLDRGTGEG